MIPRGTSTYPVEVDAFYMACRPDGAEGGVPACGPSGMPGLPAGAYYATVFEQNRAVPTPPAIPVTVVP